MAEITYNGKKPLAAKVAAKKTARLNLDDIFGDKLGIDPAIREALDKKGLSYRWISAPKLTEMGGYHDRGWTPIKLKDCGTIPSNPQAFTFGADPEGYIRRGDCVLAVRSKDMNSKHKLYLKQAADERTRAVSNKRQADELRQMAKEAGIADAVSVEEGYEDNE